MPDSPPPAAPTPPGGTPISPRALARAIDHTLLKPDARRDDVLRLLDEAAEHGFAAAMVPPCWVGLAADRLAGTETAPATVISFPFGYVNPRARIDESLRALGDGARELDTVINLSLVASGEDEAAHDDLAAWVHACRERAPGGVVLKVILETALLSDDAKRGAARLAVRAGADFVKTSTGFAPGGATLDDVRLLAEAVAGAARVKASGGIRDRATALAMLAAGAERLGTSSGPAIVAGS